MSRQAAGAARPIHIGRYLVLVLLAVAVLLPFASIVLAALHPTGSQISGLSVPESWSWSNFAAAWQEANLSRLVRSSFIIAGGVVPFALVLATLAAYSLATLSPLGGRTLSLAFVLGLTLPIELVVVALYFDLRQVGLTNSYLGVILAETALFMPFGIYWMQNHVGSVPAELLEAARVDGAHSFTILVRILLPISWPALTFPRWSRRFPRRFRRVRALTAWPGWGGLDGIRDSGRPLDRPGVRERRGGAVR